ncbi:peptidoglycan-binding LysM [Nocardioides gansuensis]|uniref:Peptidoglycan-binding LysM n=1 Tax=Nocardioides gansuensis TaxID=2138300 RepID=A0A2T8FAN2_9ACTN|nr:transglycosylase SLT domain-containing protein [Nocardioides gansuensis]PVG82778.1 peptidoglycan-binding LysM [Nocardioides gansuensis]
MRPLRRFPTTLVTALAIGAAGVTVLASPAAADHVDLPRSRDLTPYTVRSGDTATELAVRFRAWTDELISHNHLGGSGSLRVGQRIEIPVVVDAKKKQDQKEKEKESKSGSKSQDKGEPKAEPEAKGWQHADPSRERVRRTIVRLSHRYGVDPELALAVSWQEAGWQMHHVSSAHAIGAMQVLPSTGRWMEWYAGRRLHLHRLRDNVTAGVLLLGVLDDQTGSVRHQVAAYYQGLGALRRHGLYDDTQGYVANVLAIRQRLEAGRSPA